MCPIEPWPARRTNPFGDSGRKAPRNSTEEARVQLPPAQKQQNAQCHAHRTVCFRDLGLDDRALHMLPSVAGYRLPARLPITICNTSLCELCFHTYFSRMKLGNKAEWFQLWS